MTVGRTLDQRTLNRTLLTRQHLLHRTDAAVPDVIETLVGLQAQSPPDPYVGLWTRVRDFRPETLSTLLETHAVARAPLYRCTIHLATAADLLTIRPLLGPTMERMFRTGSPFGRRLPGVDMGPVLTVAEAAMDERPRTRAQLRTLLGERWPERDADAMATGVSILAPVVQTTPRGLWGRSGQATWARMETWLGRPLDAAPSVETLLLRYLAAFGPASATDAGAWAGLTRLGEVFERLRPRLRTYRSPAGRELFDLEDASLADPGLPAPVRYLPQFDDALLGHADRTRIVPPAVRGATAPTEWVGPVLVDGVVAATWRLVTEGESVINQVVPWVPLPASALPELDSEGLALARLLRPERAGHAVRIMPHR